MTSFWISIVSRSFSGDWTLTYYTKCEVQSCTDPWSSQRQKTLNNTVSWKALSKQTWADISLFTVWHVLMHINLTLSNPPTTQPSVLKQLLTSTDLSCGKPTSTKVTKSIGIKLWSDCQMGGVGQAGSLCTPCTTGLVKNIMKRCVPGEEICLSWGSLKMLQLWMDFSSPISCLLDKIQNYESRVIAIRRHLQRS